MGRWEVPGGRGWVGWGGGRCGRVGGGGIGVGEGGWGGGGSGGGVGVVLLLVVDFHILLWHILDGPFIFLIRFKEFGI